MMNNSLLKVPTVLVFHFPVQDAVRKMALESNYREN